uniref:Uncharacterized protein n=1 Tax=viral metagenome TaxID=1070528 RepID=A0A6C0ED48_9ZZZZ
MDNTFMVMLLIVIIGAFYIIQQKIESDYNAKRKKKSKKSKSKKHESETDTAETIGSLSDMSLSENIDFTDSVSSGSISFKDSDSESKLSYASNGSSDSSLSLS